MSMQVSRTGAAVMCAAMAVAVAGCGSSGGGSAPSASPKPAARVATTPAAPVATTPAQETVTGSIALHDPNVTWVDGGTCTGSGRNADVGLGARVTLMDDAGRIVGSTTMQTGTAHGIHQCDFGFGFSPTTLTATSYSIEISHRGKITDSIGELRANGLRFRLSLGS